MSQVDELGSKVFVGSSPELPHNGQKKKSFLERMREMKERQSTVKLSPRNVGAQYYKKPSSKVRSPCDNRRTSPALKKIIKEQFNREKVKYCFLPQRQIQLQQKFKGHVDSLKKKNIPSQKAGDDKFENNSSEEEAEKIGSSSGFMPISDHLSKSTETAKNGRKFSPLGDRKSEKCVKFLFPSEDDSDEPPFKIKVGKTPVKPIDSKMATQHRFPKLVDSSNDKNKDVIYCSGESMEAVGDQAESVVAQETLGDLESLSNDKNLSNEDFGGSAEQANEKNVPSLKKKEKMQFEIISSGMSSSSRSQKSSQSDQNSSVVFDNGEETSQQGTDGFLCDLFSDVEEAAEKTTEDDDETEDEENYKIF